MLKQAQNELNKKFRKSDDLTKDIADDKIESFGKVLQTFFKSEKEDYLKEKEAEAARKREELIKAKAEEQKK